MPEEYMQEILPPQSQDDQVPPDETVIVESDEEPTVIDTIVDQLNAFLAMNNIADDLDDKILTEMGSRVVKEYEIDKDSRKDWEDGYETALELAKQVSDGKEWAGEPIADIKYPTIATAAIQFSARALPNIIKGRDVVKCKIIGDTAKTDIPDDYTPETPEEQAKVEAELTKNHQVTIKEERAKRIEQFMSYQLLEEMEEWDEDLDQLLVSLPITGCVFKKTYYDPTEGIVRSPLISPKDLVAHYYTKTIEDATRITHTFELTPNEVKERTNAGVFLDIELGDPVYDEDDDRGDVDDPDAPHVFLEQHRWWDLDDDGYQEPYVVTVHRDTEKVVRVTARYDTDGIISDQDGNIIKVESVNYFTRFLFMPAFDGNFYGMGFGHLLSPLNSTINSTVNLLLDAGKLSNRQAGFLGKGIHLGRGEIRFRAGEWKSVNNTGDDLRKGIVPLPTREPSTVLFNLLSLMIEASKELSSVADVLTGEQRGANESPTTVLSLIEQALKVFSVIYKRLHRSLKEEFKKIWRLNRLYLQENKYVTVVESSDATVKDFYAEDIDLVPISDEMELTAVQRIAQAESLMQLQGMGLNDREIQKRYLQAINIREIDKILPPQLEDPPPPPEVQVEQQKMELEQGKLMLEQQKAQIQAQVDQAKIEKTKADAARSMVDVEAKRQAMEMSPELQVEMQRVEIERMREERESRKLELEERLGEETMKKTRADAMKSIADAESQEAGDQFEEYKRKLDEIYTVVETQAKILQQMVGGENDNERSTGRVEGTPGNAGNNKGNGRPERPVAGGAGERSLPEQK